MSVAAMKYDAQAINGVGPVAEKTPGEALTEILRQDKCQRYTYDDQGNGFLFADYFKKSCRYCPDIKGWYYYDGRVWKPDKGGCKGSGEETRVHIEEHKDIRFGRGYQSV